MTPRSPNKRLTVERETKRAIREAEETIIDYAELIVAQFDFQEHIQATTGHHYSPDMETCKKLYWDLADAIHYRQQLLTHSV